MKYTSENSIKLKFIQTWHLLQIIYWSEVGKWVESSFVWKYLVNKRWVELFYPMERAKKICCISEEDDVLQAMFIHEALFVKQLYRTLNTKNC